MDLNPNHSTLVNGLAFVSFSSTGYRAHETDSALQTRGTLMVLPLSAAALGTWIRDMTMTAPSPLLTRLLTSNKPILRL